MSLSSKTHGGKGDLTRPDPEDNYRKNFDNIDWGALRREKESKLKTESAELGQGTDPL